jgi:tRNA (guanine37-N1)-methyltransferase
MTLPRAFDIVGDIAIVNVDPGSEKEMVKKVMKQNKRVKTVVNKVGKTSGKERIQKVRIIAGEKRTKTLHKENGCRFEVDVNKVFFTPRLSNERMRVAEQVGKKETVVDLFAGIGPFSIPIAKKSPECEVYAVDVNEDAVAYLKRNIKLNKVGNVIALWGDAAEICEKLGRVADRIIMNLPETSVDFLDSARLVAKKGCVVHLYCFLTDEELFDKGIKQIKDVFPKAKILNKVVCGVRAPGIHRVCIDFKVV